MFIIPSNDFFASMAVYFGKKNFLLFNFIVVSLYTYISHYVSFFFTRKHKQNKLSLSLFLYNKHTHSLS